MTFDNSTSCYNSFIDFNENVLLLLTLLQTEFPRFDHVPDKFGVLPHSIWVVLLSYLPTPSQQDYSRELQSTLFQRFTVIFFIKVNFVVYKQEYIIIFYGIEMISPRPSMHMCIFPCINCLLDYWK